MKTQLTARAWGVLALAGLMTATRISPSTAHCNASWAVFLLGGALLGSSRAFVGLCSVAAALDVLAFAVGGSPACLSPAYPFLLLAYASLWWAGRWGGVAFQHGAARVALATLLGTLACYMITTGTHYALGSSAHLGASQMAALALPELLGYLASSFTYVAAGQTLVALLHARSLRSNDAGI